MYYYKINRQLNVNGGTIKREEREMERENWNRRRERKMIKRSCNKLMTWCIIFHYYYVTNMHKWYIYLKHFIPWIKIGNNITGEPNKHIILIIYWASKLLIILDNTLIHFISSWVQDKYPLSHLNIHAINVKMVRKVWRLNLNHTLFIGLIVN